MKKVIVILLLSLLWACLVNAQYPKRDTILYNQFSDYINWSKQYHKKRLEDLETEKYQMIYVDKIIIDKKHHRVYLYSSYDLAWGEENGIGINLYIKPKKKKK
jgi:predicted metal-binding transcription factor (methanogenesis marker protein 9)